MSSNKDVMAFKFEILVDDRVDGISPDNPTGSVEKCERFLFVKMGTAFPQSVAWSGSRVAPKTGYSERVDFSVADDGFKHLVKFEAQAEDEARASPCSLCSI